MENFELWLSVLGTALNLLITTLVFVLKFIKCARNFYTQPAPFFNNNVCRNRITPNCYRKNFLINFIVLVNIIEKDMIEV